MPCPGGMTTEGAALELSGNKVAAPPTEFLIGTDLQDHFLFRQRRSIHGCFARHLDGPLRLLPLPNGQSGKSVTRHRRYDGISIPQVFQTERATEEILWLALQPLL